MAYDDKEIEHCCSSIDNKLIPLTENGIRVIFRNDTRLNVKRIQVDGCAITKGERCDWLIVCETIEYYVELKGSDISKALDQVSRSIKKLTKDFRARKHATIIVRRVAPAFSSKIQVQKKNFLRDFNAELNVKGSPHTINLKSNLT